MMMTCFVDDDDCRNVSADFFAHRRAVCGRLDQPDAGGLVLGMRGHVSTAVLAFPLRPAAALYRGTLSSYSKGVCVSVCVCVFVC